MPSQGIPGKKYEEFAYVIGIKKRTRSVIIRNKTGDMLYVIGQKFLNIIEILIDDDTVFETGEKISIGTENRSKILSVLGRVPYKKMPDDVADTFSTVIDGIVAKEEQRFVKFVNTAGPLNYKNHALKAIPQISEKISQNIINERDENILFILCIREMVRFCSKYSISDSTLGGGSKFLRETDDIFLISKAQHARTDTAFLSLPDLARSLDANSSCTIITALENFFCTSHSMALLLCEYGRLETNTSKRSTDLKPSPHMGLMFGYFFKTDMAFECIFLSVSYVVTLLPPSSGVIAHLPVPISKTSSSAVMLAVFAIRSAISGDFR